MKKLQLLTKDQVLVEFDAFSARLREKIDTYNAGLVTFDDETGVVRIRMIDGDGSYSERELVFGLMYPEEE